MRKLCRQRKEDGLLIGQLYVLNITVYELQEHILGMGKTWLDGSVLNSFLLIK